MKICSTIKLDDLALREIPSWVGEIDAVEYFVSGDANTELSDLNHLPECVTGDLVFVNNKLQVSENQLRERVKVGGEVFNEWSSKVVDLIFDGHENN